MELCPATLQPHNRLIELFDTEQLVPITFEAPPPRDPVLADADTTARGLITVSFDDEGNRVPTKRLESEGDVVGGDETYRGRYAWTSREWDVEMDLQYNRARYYHPMPGRWLSQDPLGYDPGDGDLYRYVKTE